MKKAHLLLLALPVIAAFVGLRSLAAMRPQNIFSGKGFIHELAFSGDGHTLFLSQSRGGCLPEHYGTTALDAANGFGVRNTNWRDPRPGKYISPDGRWSVLHSGRSVLRYGSSSYGYDLIVNSIQQPTLSSNRMVLPTESQKKRLVAGPYSTFLTQAFSPDSKTFIVKVYDERVRHAQLDFYDTTTWKRTRTWSDFQDSPSNPEMPMSGQKQLLWSSDGRLLLSTSVNYAAKEPQTIVALWRVSDGTKLYSRTFTRESETSSSATSNLDPFQRRTLLNAFSLQNDGRVLMKGWDGRLYLEKLGEQNFESSPVFSLPSEYITDFTLSPDETYVVVGTDYGHLYYKDIK